MRTNRKSLVFIQRSIALAMLSLAFAACTSGPSRRTLARQQLSQMTVEQLQKEWMIDRIQRARAKEDMEIAEQLFRGALYQQDVADRIAGRKSFGDKDTRDLDRDDED